LKRFEKLLLLMEFIDGIEFRVKQASSCQFIPFYPLSTVGNVKGTFAWTNFYCRLNKDYEKTP
ncbi:MAG: hypothetical protein NZ108_09945, partial [Bacteroidia bacterium]|nr:hypothetical protein [Bacteroidia bacterium]